MARLSRKAFLHPASLVAAWLAAFVLLAAGWDGARAEHREISARRAIERKTFTDEEIAYGFFRIAFGAEMGLGGRVDRIRKFMKPVRVYVETSSPERRFALSEIIADIQSRIEHIDIAVVEKRSDANLHVHIVRDRDLARAIRKIYGAHARKIIRNLRPQCLSGFSKDERFRIVRSDVFLVSDVGEFVFYDCAYEEMLQALGPIQDDSSVPWSMFNDNVQMGFFDVYDQYLLNILYHPKVRPGMTKAELRALLPEILPDVRAFVARRNNLAPQAVAEPRGRPARSHGD